MPHICAALGQVLTFFFLGFGSGVHAASTGMSKSSSAAYFHLKVGQWLSIALCLALMLCAVIFTPPTRPDRRGGITAAALAIACAVGIVAVHGGLLHAEAKQNTSETFS